MRIEPNPFGSNVSRYIEAFVRGKSLSGAFAVAEERRDSPAVALTLKGVIAAMSSGTSSAGALASYGISAELISLLNPVTVLGRVRDRMRRVPFRVRVPRELVAAGGGWVGLGAPIPVTRPSLDGLTLESNAAGVIVVVSKEQILAGGPAGEASVRQIVVNGVAAFLDAQLLDPAVGPVAEQQPGSITNGIAAIPSTGATTAAHMTDIATAMAAITTDCSALVVITSYTVAKKYAADVTASGDRAFPGINLATGGTINGVPLILSRNVPAGLVVVVDLAEILLADDGVSELAVSEASALQMTDTPAAGAAALVSMFQTNNAAIRVVRDVSWARARPGAVAYITGV